MDVPINAKVFCQSEECGKTTCVIITPASKMITHIVIQEKGFIGIKRLIPVEEILESKADQITLRCSLNEFSKFESFTESHYIGSDEPFLDYWTEHYYYHP